MSGNVYTRSVVRAAELAGGYEALAKELGADVCAVRSWADGLTTPQSHHFLGMARIILEDTSEIRIKT